MMETTKKDIDGSDMEEEEKALLLEAWEKNRSTFMAILNPKEYQDLVSEGVRKISRTAFLGALMISMHREEPKYNLPYQLLTLLTEMDAHMTKWRHQHLQMVQRMIGSKVGTGGSSGYQYLRTTITDRYKVFVDLFALPTYILPRRFISPLPESISTSLDYSK